MSARVRLTSVRRVSVAVIGGLLISGVLTANPAQAVSVWDGDRGATSELNDVEMPADGTNKNTSEGGASEMTQALDEARRTDEPVPVDALLTETEQFIANPDGTVTREIAQAPVRVREDGEWVEVDADLEASGDRLEPKAAAGEVSFSDDGTGALASTDIDGQTFSMSLLQAELSKPAVDGATATYEIPAQASAPTPEPSPSSEPSTGNPTTPDAPVTEPENPDSATDGQTAGNAGEQVRVAVKNGGFAAHVILDGAPEQAPSYVFELRTGSLTPSLEDGALSLTNTDGEEVGRSLPLRMWDAQVDDSGDPTNVADVDAQLQRSGDRWLLTLTPNMEYLTAETTKYPVVVDPDIAQTYGDAGDTHFRSGADANTFFGDDPRIEVGSNDGMTNRGFVSFKYNQFLGSNITSAKLSLYQYFAPTCTDQPMLVHSMSRGDRDKPVWNTQPNFSTDERWTERPSFNHPGGSPGCYRAREDIDVTSIVSGWAGAQVGPHSTGHPVHENRQAFILRTPTTSPDQFKRFCSKHWSSDLNACNNANVIPRLHVTFSPELGEQSWYSMTERELDDRTTVKVNNRNGNLFVQSADLNVKGRGLDLSVNRTYNSRSDKVGPMGRGWSLNVGPDVWLEKKSEWRYDFHTPGGTVLGSFVRKRADHSNADQKKEYDTFVAPLGGIGSELEQTDNGFVLTFRKSQEKYVFNQTNSDGDAFMTKIKDRSDNEIVINYSGTAGAKPRMSSIKDTFGRIITPTYTGNTVTKWATQDLQGVGVRQWNFTYAGEYLASASDALGAVTDYTYTSPQTGLRLLNAITAPQNNSGARPQTQVEYKDGDGTVAALAYRHGNNANDTYRYSWNYNSGRVEACDGNGRESTEVTDPRQNVTTYCYSRRDNAASNAKIWVYDALDNARSEDFNSDNQPLTATGASGQSSSVAEGSTVGKYSDDIPDQLTQITSPRSQGSSGGKTSQMTYTGASAPGGDYLPRTVKNGAGDCNRYEYDDKGRTTAAFSGLNAGNCTGTGGRGFKSDYNEGDRDDGTLKATWDANAGDNPGDDDKTIYTYYDNADGSRGQVKTVRKPGGNCSTGSDRRLCTSYVYDGASRVIQMTDGRGIVTKYSYDANDRTTGVFYNGTDASQCSFLTPANCIQYSYDAAGNMTARQEEAGQSVFTYDRLNRQTSQATPDSPLSKDRIDYTYDEANNLISYSQTLYLQAADVTNYTYDEANRPTTVTSAVGTFKLKHDEDARLNGITFPNPNNSFGLDLSYEYTKDGEPTKLDWRFAGNTRAATWTYDYKDDGGADNSRMRTRKLDVNGASDQEGTTTYKYDDERLVSAIRSGSTAAYDHRYTYDRVGNIRSENTNGTIRHYGYNKAGERCWFGPSSDSNSAVQVPRTCGNSPSGATNLTADAAGNNTGTGSDAVQYNARNQVSQIAGANQGHLDQGNDIRRLRGNERQISGAMGLTATTSSAGTTYYTRAPDGTILAGRVNNTSWFYVTEPNGHVAYITDVNGASLGGYDYTPYGKTTVIGSADFNPIRYLSAHQDTGTLAGGDQLYKFGARYYATSGAFTQPDALSGGLGDPRTMTAYNYAGGDPINQQDASGYFFGEIDQALKGASVLSGWVGNIGLISDGISALQAGDANELAALALGASSAFFVGAACTTAFGSSGVALLGCGYAAGKVGDFAADQVRDSSAFK